MHITHRFFIGAALSTSFIACGADKANSNNEELTGTATIDSSAWPKVQIAAAKTVSGRYSVSLRSNDSSLSIGYDSLGLIIKDSTGQLIKDAKVEWYPLMDMGMMKHSAPVDAPVQTSDSTGLHRAGVLWVMATQTDGAMAGTWTLTIRINPTGTQSDSVIIPVTIKNVTPSPIVWFKPDSTTKQSRVVALVGPHHPIVGANDFELYIGGNDGDKLKWGADTTWNVHFVPTMPSMGHSSPHNVDPIHVGNGHYKGKVNYSMSGDWRLTFDFAKTDVSIVDTLHYIDLQVQE